MAMHFPTTHGQRGAVLIISLVLLMVLTILAISTMRTASLGLLMAGNTQYRQNAWQLAQADDQYCAALSVHCRRVHGHVRSPGCSDRWSC